MIVGIDLGTTYTAAAYLDENGAPHIIPNREGDTTTPSVVMFEGDNVVVGQEAKDNSMMNPLNVASYVKQEMGNPSYEFINEDDRSFKPEDISAIILKRVKADCEQFLGVPVNTAVITVPAYFGDAERKATMDAGRIAGLNVIGIINEPTAAALAFGMTKGAANQTVLIYDLGGGTFDVTLVEINDGKIVVKATHGDKRLGGFNFDNELMLFIEKVIMDETGYNVSEDLELEQDIRIKAEKMKRALSSRDEYSFTVKANGKNVKIRVTRDMFNAMIKSTIEATEASIDTVLEDADITPSKIDKVLLVGGSTRVPAVRAFVQQKLGIVPSSEVNPDEAVAIGAAFYAQDFGSEPTPVPVTDDDRATYTAEKRFVDVNSHGLGIAVSEAGGMVNSIIIPRNSQIPVRMENVYSTTVDNQTMIKLQITEGDDTDLRYVTQIGVTMVPITPRPKGSPIKVGFSLDENSIIHVFVIDVVDDKILCESIVERNANMSETELQEKEKRMNEINPQ